MSDNLISLRPKQEIKQELFRRASQTTEERIKELEQNVIQLMEHSLQNERDIDSMRQALARQESYTRKLMHLILRGGDQ